MQIIKLKITNYRNLDYLEIKNKSNIKYIIGNNGVGKSNTLDAINSFFNKSSFNIDDFYNDSKPIEIEIGLLLNKTEFGYFDDIFDIEDENVINIKAIQDSPNDRIEYFHSETNTAISYQKIKNLPCVYYNSVNAPEELNFIKTKNSGKFLNSLIETYIMNNEINVEELINSNKIDSISNHLNTILNMINFVSSNELTVDFEHNILDLLPRLVELKDRKNMSVNKMGSGVRFSSYIYFELLNKIMQTLEKNMDSIISTNDNKKYISIFILLDEPEIHLHPYMQRSVINDIRNILNNNDKKFLELLKIVFNLDGIFGQLIVVTHSPNIISCDFHEIIRLDSCRGKIRAYTDDNSNFTDKEEKHFVLQNEKIKEVFFSKSCILVEGVTERIIMPIFAKKIGYDFDDLNIGLLQADGADSIPSLVKILKHFGINTVALMDKDKYKPEYKEILHTHYTFLEEEYIMNLLSNKRIHVLYNIAKNSDTRLDLIIQKNLLEKVNKKIKLPDVEIRDYKLIDAIRSNLNNQKILVLTTFLYSNKITTVSTVLANESSIIDIPSVYLKAINKVVSYAKK